MLPLGFTDMCATVGLYSGNSFQVSMFVLNLPFFLLTYVEYVVLCFYRIITSAFNTQF